MNQSLSLGHDLELNLDPRLQQLRLELQALLTPPAMRDAVLRMVGGVIGRQEMTLCQALERVSEMNLGYYLELEVCRVQQRLKTKNNKSILLANLVPPESRDWYERADYEEEDDNLTWQETALTSDNPHLLIRSLQNGMLRLRCVVHGNKSWIKVRRTIAEALIGEKWFEVSRLSALDPQRGFVYLRVRKDAELLLCGLREHGICFVVRQYEGRGALPTENRIPIKHTKGDDHA